MSGTELRPPRAFRVVARLIDAASLIVPSDDRLDWRNEWKAELWYRARTLESDGVRTVGASLRLIRYALGALPDAATLRLSSSGWTKELTACAARLARRPVQSAFAVATLAICIALQALLVAVGVSLWELGVLARAVGFASFDAQWVLCAAAIVMILVGLSLAAAHAAAALARNRGGSAFATALVIPASVIATTMLAAATTHSAWSANESRVALIAAIGLSVPLVPLIARQRSRR